MSVTLSGVTYDLDQAGWGSALAYDDLSLDGLWVPDKVVVHWGGNTIPPVTTWGINRLFRSWQRFHRGKGWQDIAYGAGVGNDGLTRRLRGWNHQGATSGDFENDGIPENAEAFACVWAGGAGGAISPKAYQAMASLVANVLAVIDVPVDVVIGHRQVKGNTICPGSEWMDWVQEEGWLAAQEDDMQSNLAALQKQTPEWYDNLKALTGHPGGRAGYWGESHDENGNRVAPAPNDQEWASAYEELWTAQVTASTLGGDPGTTPPHAHPEYADKSHPHSARSATTTTIGLD